METPHIKGVEYFRFLFDNCLSFQWPGSAVVGPDIYIKPLSNRGQNITKQICICAVRYIVTSGSFYLCEISHFKPKL